MAALDVYGGIEGGGTKTTIVLMNLDGEVLSEAEGPSSNHWLIGLDECAKRIAALVKEAKTKASLDVNRPLKSLGLSMSGGDSQDARKNIEETIKSQQPSISESYYVRCDIDGAIATAFKEGGAVMIAGTGSNCAVLNPDGSSHRVGGWGHAIGDEGSGYFVSYYCLKKMFDIMDNFDNSELDTTFVWNTMRKHFNVKDRMDFLEHLYPTQDKSRFAAMCTEVARGNFISEFAAMCTEFSRGAAEENDALCKEAFHKCGWHIGRHILAIAPKVDKALFKSEGSLQVACIGSVFKSWDLLKDGFLEGIKVRNDKDVKIKEITLLQLTRPGHIGATYLGAKHAGFSIKADYAANSTQLFHADNL